MKEAKRARRRRDLARMKAKAKRLYWWSNTAITLANHLTSCSCAYCGNPRRWFDEKTMQEKKRQEADNDELY